MFDGAPISPSPGKRWNIWGALACIALWLSCVILPLRADLTPQDIPQEKLFGHVLKDGWHGKSTYVIERRSDRFLSGKMDTHSPPDSSYEFEIELRGGEQWRLHLTQTPGGKKRDYDLNVFPTVRGPALMGHESLKDGKATSFVVIWLDSRVREHPYNFEFSAGERADPIPNEDIEFEVFTAENGLVHNSTRSIIQTPDAFIWVATVGGLSRFDGTTWKPYAPNTVPSIPVENISDLSVDQQGRLVIATRGAGVLRLEGNQFVPVPGNDLLADPDIQFVHVAIDGSIWATPHSGESFYRLRRNGDLLERSLESLNFPFPRIGRDVDEIERIFPFSTDLMVINTRSTARLFNPATGDVVHLANLWAWNAYPTPRGGLLMRNYNLLARLTPEMDEIPLLQLDIPPEYGAVFEDKRGVIWMGHTKSLYSFEKGDLESYPAVARELDSKIVEIIEDKEGSLWLASGSRGVGFLKRKESLHYTWNDTEPENNLRGDSITIGLRYDHEGRLLVARNAPRFEIWNRSGTNRSIVEMTNWNSADSLDFARDGSDEQWFGVSKRKDHFSETDTNQPQPILIRHSAGDQTYFRQTEFPWAVDQVSSVAWRNPGEVWLATDRGVFQLREEQLHYWNREESLPEFDALCTFVDSKKRVWIGTDGHGLFRVDSEGVREFTQMEDGLSSDTIYAVHESDDGVIWAGGGTGITRIEGEEVAAVYLDPPFEVLAVRMIIQDDQSNFWLGTFKGLICVRRDDLDAKIAGLTEELPMRKFGRGDGIPNEAIYLGYFPAAARAPNGDLAFAMEDGMIRFFPKKLLKSATRGPPVRITDCSSVGMRYFDEGLDQLPLEGERLLLPSEAQNFLEIGFAATAFYLPKMTRYQYRLKGKVEKWSELDEQPSSRYSSLGPGDYEFEVRAFNHNHNRSPVTASLAITIAPYYFQTWWFRGGVLFVIFGGVWAFLRYRVHTTERIKELEKDLELDEERSRIARDMHDEIGSSLAQIRIMGELASEDLGDSEEARKIKQLADRAHKSSSSLREIIWSLNPSKKSVQDLRDYVEQLAHDYFDGSGIKVMVDGDGLGSVSLASPELKRELVLIVKGVMSNVLKHSEASEFTLQFRIADGALWIIAKDDGVGFDPENVDQDSHGMQSLRERAGNLSGNLTVETSKGKGTTLTFDIPL